MSLLRPPRALPAPGPTLTAPPPAPGDELAAAWAIFTPLLHRLDAGRVQPFVYPYGSRGPAQSDHLIKRYGYVYEGRYGAEWKHRHGAPGSAEGASKPTS